MNRGVVSSLLTPLLAMLQLVIILYNDKKSDQYKDIYCPFKSKEEKKTYIVFLILFLNELSNPMTKSHAVLCVFVHLIAYSILV